MPIPAPIVSAAAVAAAVVYAGAKRPAAAVRKAAALGSSRKNSLDQTAKKTRRHKAVLADEFNRSKALELLRAGDIRGAGSLAICGTKPVAGSVSLKLNTETGRASFGGLRVCGSVWVCPSCTKAVSERRREELNTLLAGARAEGLSVHLITLTARHGADTNLSQFLEAMRRAKERLHQRREWRALPYQGSVTALEVTHGSRNGFHAHFHMLVLTKGDTQAVFKSLKALAPVWRVCLDAFGLSGGKAAFDVQDGSAAGAYVAKGTWGAAAEISLGHAKVAAAGSRTPWQLLADAALGDERAARLWSEYARAFAGRRQLVWSKGLKARFKIGETTDEQAAAEAENAAAATVVLRTFSATEWALIVSRKCAILRAAERGASIERAMFGPTDRARWLRLQGDLSAEVWL